MVDVRRYTFIVQVRPGGIATLENLSTREQIPVRELGRIGAQIEQWLEALTGADARTGSAMADESQREERPDATR